MACLYVARGAGGLLKAGMTANPKNRRRTLACEFRKNGDLMVEVIFFEEISDIHLCEYWMHAELHGVLRGPIRREWYASGDFDAAKAVIERISSENKVQPDLAPASKRRTRSEVKEV